MTSTVSTIWCWLVLCLYLGLRLWFLPTDWMAANFSHDSAYIARLAENLREGNGFVNDAHWLVFLQPERLPMPYHNANPLYPLLIASISAVTGMGVIPAGFAISAIAHAGLMVGVVLLLQPWLPSLRVRCLYALGVGFFPPLFADSLTYLPDMLCLVLPLLAVVCLVRWDSPGSASLAGALLGLAWLTRSSASLLAPLFLIYLLGRYGWKSGFVRLAILGGVALVVASPWLWHTHQVWGSPFRSDAGYYLMQEYHAANHHDGETERFWHSLEKPASLSEVLQTEPAKFLEFYLRSIVPMIRQIAARYGDGHLWLALFLTVSALVALMRLDWRGSSHSTSLLVGSLVSGLLIVAALVPRAVSLELRYLAPLSLMLALLLTFGLIRAVAQFMASATGWKWGNVIVVVLSLGYWFAWVPYQNWREYQHLATPIPERLVYRQMAQELAAATPEGEAVVVGFSPYFYTLATGRAALSIPSCAPDCLTEYMGRYRARYVFLTTEELIYWLPITQNGPPPGLTPGPNLQQGDATVYEFQLKEHP